MSHPFSSGRDLCVRGARQAVLDQVIAALAPDDERAVVRQRDVRALVGSADHLQERARIASGVARSVSSDRPVRHSAPVQAEVRARARSREPAL